MKQTTGLSLRPQQTLALSPQLEQGLQLLAMPAVELRQAIDEALAKNPLLMLSDELDDTCSGKAPAKPPDPSLRAPVVSEAAENTDFDAAASAEREIAYWESHGGHWEEEPTDPYQLIAETEGLTEHLHRQAALTPIPEALRPAITIVIEAIDENGYLSVPLEELATWSDPPLEGTVLQEALAIVQGFDPTGVGARTLAECLLLQLADRPATPEQQLAEVVVRDHLTLLARHDYPALQKALGVDAKRLKAAVALIERLDPKPGRRYARTTAPAILPDLLAVADPAGWRVELNPAAYPRVVVAPFYHQQIGRKSPAEWRQLLTEAKQFVKQLQQRAVTLVRVGQAIVERQRDYFAHGDVALRPLTLKEIAEAVELHESTVSRAIAGKTLLSPRGVVPLKHFFATRLTTESGATTSNAAIKSRIAALIAEEPPTAPLSDTEIAARLAAEGIVIARRTVAKYRDSLSIPPAVLRRRL